MRDVVPAEEFRQLDQRYQTNLHKILLTAGELIRLLDVLESTGLEVMPYKGLALAELLYGDVAARQSGDIDLLIHKRDLGRIKDAVHELGYTTHLELSEREERAYLISGYECVFDGLAGKNFLEVQWALQPRFYAVDFDVESLFRRAVPVNVAGRQMKTPWPEDLVLILATHAAKHGWSRLIWLCDIARLMQSPTMDWTWVETQAKKLGIVRMLRVTFLLAQRLLHATIPAALENTTSHDGQAQARAQSVSQRIGDERAVDVESWRYFRATAGLRERRMDQGRLLWRLAFTPGPGEWRTVRLPSALFPLYRLVRLYRLAARLMRG